MRINLFSSLLAILMLALITKASLLFGRIQEQTTYTFDSSASSVFVDTAYAKAEQTPSKAEKQDSNSNDLALNQDHGNPIPVDSNLTNQKPIETANENLPSQVVLPTNISNSELQLLKELSQRRQNLDKTREDLEVRKQLLQATEDKIDQKMTELRSIQAQLEEIMKEYNKQEHEKTKKLVKIYENMKPREAAKILDEMEMPILLVVVSNMKEIKLAPIIASMNPQKARELSTELAKQRSLN